MYQARLKGKRTDPMAVCSLICFAYAERGKKGAGTEERLKCFSCALNKGNSKTLWMFYLSSKARTQDIPENSNSKLKTSETEAKLQNSKI